MSEATAMDGVFSGKTVGAGIGDGSAGLGGSILEFGDGFLRRHLGPSDAETELMLNAIGYESLEALAAAAVPDSIKLDQPLEIGEPRGEFEVLRELKAKAEKNEVFRSAIGMGYYGTITPPVILRNVLENPGWYTQYTPYQAEISQGRLEALLNFQTMVSDLTGLPLAGASLLDEGTAAAEAMGMCVSIARHKRMRFIADERCHPQTLAVLATRAEGLDVTLDVCDALSCDFGEDVCGVLVQYPDTDGVVKDFDSVCERAHAAGALVVAATDLLALTLLKAPGEWGHGGADIAVGSAQRFGVPMGFGGPHAGFISTSDKHARKLPGRIIGVSKDRGGNTALRMAIQTREQHIRRDKATSNICTAQALLAIMAGFYAAYHGPGGLTRIAKRTQSYAAAFVEGIRKLGHERVGDGPVFDTVRVRLGAGAGKSSLEGVVGAARYRRINLREHNDGTLSVSFDETTDRQMLRDLLAAFNGGEDVDADAGYSADALVREAESIGMAGDGAGGPFKRESEFLTHPVFNSYHSETEMLRYIFSLQEKDLSLAHSMIALGSCTMKLNATSEMLPVTWAEFGNMHPFAPRSQWEGYATMFNELERWLAELTGFAAVSLQPNAGAQGEYTGLMVIRAYHLAHNCGERDVCLIPTSAHGTNPASAIMAGMRVVAIQCDDKGNIDMADLREKAEAHKDKLAALMITYPSTHGVFEASVKEACAIVKDRGGRVYMDGANMNAQVGLTNPGVCGADVCHLNLHKTFCIPHGGGGPGMGPIGVVEDLAPFLPGHPVVTPAEAGEHAIGPVSAAPYGSASILTISWVYIALMGGMGLTRATQVAILNANYMAKRLEEHFDVLYTAPNGLVAHEFIIDCRPFDKGGAFDVGVSVEDIAKRLIDYGFHAPTMSWPVAGTMMIEPTESESKEELDRFCDALIGIREEIGKIQSGEWSREDNPVKLSPHTVADVSSDDWDRGYSRSAGGYPAEWLRARKFWPSVGRIDNAYGDRHLICTCPSVEEVAG